MLSDHEFTETENKVLRFLLAGQPADLAEGREIDLDLVDEWGEERVIRSRFLQRVCLEAGTSASNYTLPQGIQIRGAKVEGALALRSLALPFKFHLNESSLPDGIDLRQATVSSVDLSGSRTGNLNADGIRLANDFLLNNGFQLHGTASFVGARIGGRLLCGNSRFLKKNPEPPPDFSLGCDLCRISMRKSYSLLLTGARIGGSVEFCGGFQSQGGLQLSDCLIGGNLNCTGATIKALHQRSDLAKKTTGRRLHCRNDIDHHAVCAFNGEGLTVEGNLLLTDVTIIGETRLTCASIGKDLDGANGRFFHPDGHAIYGDRMQVRGNVFFSDGFQADGSVRFPRAVIHADLSFFGGKIVSHDEQARCLYCEAIRVHGTIYLKHFLALSGCIDFSFSSVDGNFDCTDSHFIAPGTIAIKALGMQIQGTFFLCSENDCLIVEAPVCLTGTNIGMDLICTNGSFSTGALPSTEKSSYAIRAENVTVSGKVKMDGCHFIAVGGVCLDYSNIGSYLDCRQATFATKAVDCHHHALSAAKLKVAGSVKFNGGAAEGEVRLNEAFIGRNLDFEEASITNPRGYTLWAQQMRVEGSIFFRSFEAKGEIHLNHVFLGGNLISIQAAFINTTPVENKQELDQDEKKLPYALRAEGATIEGFVKFIDVHVQGVVSFEHAEVKMRFLWKEIENRSTFSLHLSAASVGVLDDSPQSWPIREKWSPEWAGFMRLTDFEYHYLEDLHHESLRARRKQWLALQRNFRPQPYEHLAAVLRKNGHEREATEVLIEKNIRSRQLPVYWARKSRQTQGQSPRIWLYKSIHGALVRYGYKPAFALRWAALLILLGWMVFYFGFKHNLMVPSLNKQQPNGLYQIAKTQNGHTSSGYNFGWYSLIYSCDTFIPVINLQTASQWLPTAYPGQDDDPPKLDLRGLFLCLFRWGQIIFGWIISSFYIVAIGNLVRR